MNWLERLFPRPPLTLISQPSFRSLKIRVGEKFIAPEELSTLTGAKYVPWLEMGSERVHRTLCRLAIKLRRKKKLSLEQLWHGNYYRKEIESGYIPDVSLRWIDENIGWGLFAERSFKPKEYIAEYTGILRKWRRSDRKNAYCFEYVHESGSPTGYLIDARDQSGIARYINHSPNANLQPTLATIGDVTHVILLVKKSVQKGEQLCYDYGPAYWSNRKAPVIFC
jgi:hypothetical protein